MRRALELFIESLGTEHPSSCTVAENYFVLLQAMGWAEDEIKGELASLLQHGVTLLQYRISRLHPIAPGACRQLRRALTLRVSQRGLRWDAVDDEQMR
jgi:hypothetical protein